MQPILGGRDLGGVTGEFAPDDLQERGEDRRTLLEKMASASREHEYMFANESQNRFAREFIRQGLITTKSRLHGNLLADVEQYFQTLIYYPLICTGVDNAIVSAAILREVVEPLSIKYSANQASTKTIMNALGAGIGGRRRRCGGGALPRTCFRREQKETAARRRRACGRKGAEAPDARYADSGKAQVEIVDRPLD